MSHGRYFLKEIMIPLDRLDLEVTNNRQYSEVIITEMTNKSEAWAISFIHLFSKYLLGSSFFFQIDF